MLFLGYSVLLPGMEAQLLEATFGYVYALAVAGMFYLAGMGHCGDGGESESGQSGAQKIKDESFGGFGSEGGHTIESSFVDIEPSSSD